MTKSEQSSQGKESKGISASEISRAHFTWRRWWLPAEFELQSGWGTPIFLPDPEGKFEKYYNRWAATITDLAANRLLILCGEPAAGKTTVINDHFQDSAPDVLLIRFREVLGEANFNERCFASEKWNALKAGKIALRLIVESLDEGRAQFSNLFDHILSEIRALRSESRRKLSVILTCRTYDWAALKGREDELKQLLDLAEETTNESIRDITTIDSDVASPQAYCVWKLCPLRRVDAIAAGTQVFGFNGEQFLEAVYRRGMEGFAAWPNTLKMLLREYSAGTLEKKTRRELYEDYSLELCRYRRDSDQEVEEWDSTSEERFETTRQLAALLVCSGKKFVCLDRYAELEESDLGIAQITQPLNGRRGAQVLSEGDVRRALKTAIFSEYGPLRFGFNQAAHQECLAAGFLATFPLIQLRPLFFRTDAQGKHVVPSLTHTASWIAEQHESFRSDLIECNPLTLLRCDITDLPAESRPILVSKLLELAASPDFINPHRLYFEGLIHPVISDQFRSYLIRSDLPDDARDLLFDMMKQVAPLDMKEELLAICRKGSTPQKVYSGASRVLVVIAQQEGTAALVALLNDETFLAQDVQLNVRGMILQKLIPARLPAREAFQWIKQGGGFEKCPIYHVFLDAHLPEALTVADLPAGLSFFEGGKQWPSGLSSKAALALRIVTLALENLDDPEISAVITRQWLEKHRKHEVYPFGAEKKIKERFKDSDLRHKFVDRLLDAIEEEEKKEWAGVCIAWSSALIPEDLLWVLGQISEASGRKQRLWAKLFASNFSWFSQEFFETHHEEIFATMDRVPQFKTLLDPVFAAIELDSEIADTQRQHFRDQQELKKTTRRRRNEASWEQVVQNRLRKICADPRWWCNLVQTLRHDPTWNYGKPEDDDDDRLIGWRYLTTDQQKIALEGARAFLLTEEPSKEATPDRSSLYCEAAGPAVELIGKELDSREDICAAIGGKWIPSIIWHGFMNRPEDKRRVVDILHRKWPNEVLAAFRADLECSADKHDGLVMLCFYGFENCFDDNFYALVRQFLCESDRRAQTVSDIAEWLTEHHPGYFVRLLQEAMTSSAAYPRDTIFSLLAVGIRQMPKETWPHFAPLVFAEESAKELIWEAATIDLVRRSSAFDGISETDLGRFYERVAHLYPQEEDPPHKSGFQAKNSRYSVGSFRALIAQELVNRATPEAVIELGRLREIAPSAGPELLWKEYQAVENLRTKSWYPPPVESIAAMIFSPGDSRLVETAEALLDAVIESFARLQKRLNETSNPRILEFWRLEVGGSAPLKNRNRGPLYEEDISWRLAAWLQDDLNRWFPTIIGREVQARWDQRHDIVIDAVMADLTGRERLVPRVVVEVKGTWHPAVASAAKTQLAEKYLTRQPSAAGLYLVCWFGAEFEDENGRRSKLGTATIEAAQRQVDKQVADAASEYRVLIKGLVLDFTLHEAVRGSLASASNEKQKDDQP